MYWHFLQVMTKTILKVQLPLISKENLLNRFSLLRQLSLKILPEYRFKWPQMLWWNDHSFNKYLDLFDEAQMPNADRRYNLYQLLRLTHSVLGDTVEIGAYKGAMSYLICQHNSTYSDNRIHHIFDSFEGLSSPSDSLDGSHWKPGALACPEEIVLSNLNKYHKNIALYKGWVPTRFSEVSSKIFSFIHIDVDLYQPTLDSLSFFYERVNAGGLIVCDDYGFTSCPGATQACDEFFLDKQEKMIGMADGGGFMIKGIRVS